ncbi:MAG TPA: hypothetical protein VEC06_12555 [Paucimonas sp.]|nr:hypothetical protein [Paucimonas sp.]
MKRRFTSLGALALLLASAAQAEPAVTTRATDLLAQAFSDAATVASLAADTKVEVLRRNGAWSEVKTAAGQTGWVRMLALKFGDGSAKPAAGQAANPLGALNALVSAGRTSNNATVTTGVRGLDAEDLQNAQANPEELKKLRKFAADKPAAQAFARQAKLEANQVEYLPPPGPGNARGTESSGSREGGN